MKSRIVLGVVLAMIWGIGQAQHSILSLRKQSAEAKTDSARSRLYYELGKKYTEENLDSCFYFLNQSLRLAQQTRDPFATARAMCRLGFTSHFYLRNEVKTLEWCKAAIAVAKPRNDFRHMAQAFVLLSEVGLHLRIGDSEELRNRALMYAKKANDWETLTETYNAFIAHYFRIKKYTELEKIIPLAMAACREHDRDIWFTLGLDYCNMLDALGKTREAEEFARRLDAEKHSLRKTTGDFIYTNDLGQLATRLGKYDEAEALLLKGIALENQKVKPDSFHLLHYRRSLVDMYRKQGAFEKALQQSDNLTELRLWLQQKRQTRDSKLQMTEMKAALDLEKKEAQIALLGNEKNEQRILLAGACLIAALLIGFVVVLQRNKRRIERQKAELTSLNATKDKLFAVLSHDLKSPVAGLKNFLMLTHWGVLSQAEFAHSIHVLTAQLNNVHVMLDNVLNWSITQMRGIHPRMEKLPILPIIEDEIEVLLPTSEAKNMTIIRDLPADAELIVDKNHAAVIFRNLLQNAIKFTPPGGKITISQVEKEGVRYVVIEDTGIGMTDEQLQFMYQSDNQIPDIGTTREQGTGLGLVLVKQLVKANHGTIQVNAERMKGTKFTIGFKSGEEV
jgi:signal transduction histidine kinase